MAKEDELGVLPRRVMTSFLLLDTSGSMSDNGNIDKVNSAIEEMIPLLKEVSDENADAEIKIAVMEFSSGCKWVTRDVSDNAGVETLDTFFWNDLKAGGLTDMGAAFLELEKRLSRSEFLASATGAYAPVIILLSDGGATDDIKPGLAKLKKNNWYRAATKIAIAVDNADKAALEAFTGSSETVVEVNSNRDKLKDLLSRLVVVSSTMQSRSKTAATNENDEQAAQQAAQEAVAAVTAETSSDDTGAPPASPWGNTNW